MPRLGSWKPPRVASQLNDLFDRMHQTSEFWHVLQSKSLETDQQVFALSRQVTPRTSDYELRSMFERTAMQYTTAIWTQCFRAGPYFAAFRFQDVLAMLRDYPTLATQRAIYASKRAFLDLRLVAHCRLRSICCVLPCCEPGAFVMNSLRYCQTHRGLALLHAMRHACRACRLFSVLVLKPTGGDQNHQFNNVLHMTVPMARAGGPLRPSLGQTEVLIHVRRHCGEGFDPLHDTLYYHHPRNSQGDLTFWAE